MVCGTALFAPPELPIGMCLVDDDDDDEELDELDRADPDEDLPLEFVVPPTGPCDDAAGAGA